MVMAGRKKYHVNQVGIRMVRERTLYSEEPISHPSDAVKLVSKALADFDREATVLINMQTDGKPINININSIGTLDRSIMNPRELVKTSILSNASSVILLHNHPSGNLVPSKEDIRMTDRINNAYGLMGIILLDHIILDGHGRYYSFLESGILPEADIPNTLDIAEISSQLKKNRSVIQQLREENAGNEIQKPKTSRNSEIVL
jgi:DNA repair protein RadC